MTADPPSPAEVATVGDNCIDRDLARRSSTVGGNAVNVAVQSRRQGRAVAYFGAVGRDRAGDRTFAALRERGVDTRGVRQIAGRTAFTDLAVDADGERIIALEDFGTCLGYRPDEAEIARLSRMRHVHIGWLDDGGRSKRRLAAAGASLSQDLAVNPGADGLGIAFASAGPSPSRARALAGAALAEGARLVVVTMGPLGSYATDGAREAETGIRAVPIIDTTGAGDTFVAAFIHTHLARFPLADRLAAGRDAAAETCTHLGGFPQAPDPLD